MDQFRQLRPGEWIGGLPSRPWNKMMGLLKPEADGPTLPGQPDTSVEFLVKNTTASPVPRGGVLQINAPYTLHADNAALFFESDTRKGTTPAADKPFVILQEPVSASGFGVGRAVGYSKALVNVTDAAHTHAAPTTATDKLTSGTSGPALIVHKPSGTGDKWCDVLLLGQAAAGGGSSVTASHNVYSQGFTESFGTKILPGTSSDNWAVGTYVVHLFIRVEPSAGTAIDAPAYGTLDVTSGTATIGGQFTAGGSTSIPYTVQTYALAGATPVWFLIMETTITFVLIVTATAQLSITVNASTADIQVEGGVTWIKVA